jgi:hypothetical protein
MTTSNLRFHSQPFKSCCGKSGYPTDSLNEQTCLFWFYNSEHTQETSITHEQELQNCGRVWNSGADPQSAFLMANWIDSMVSCLKIVQIKFPD